MIQISLQDTDGNELYLNDVIAVHYPNERHKTFGILYFDECHFLLKFENGWESLHPACYESIERLCNLDDHPTLVNSLRPYLGKIGVTKKADMWKLEKVYDIINETLIK